MSTPHASADTAVCARDLFSGARTGRAHAMGLGGVGVAGLAALLQDAGWRLDGCDTAEGPLMPWARARGMDAKVGHAAAHLDPRPDVLIRSAAVPLDHPEILRAQEAGIPVCARGEALAAWVSARPSIAIAGTHGKTTTTALLVQVLRAADQAPAYALGGTCAALDGPGGGTGTPLLVEADESDGTLRYYAPHTAVIGNIEPDHLEHFGSVDALEACFEAFAFQTRDRVWCGYDDPRARALAARCPHARTFGLSAGAWLQGRRDGCCMEVVQADRVLGSCVLPAPGDHNARNALAVLAVAMSHGVSFTCASRAITSAVLPARRYERVVDREEVMVVSDYAHHPTEIRALMAMARQEGRRILAVFQPHRYTRTLAMGPAFVPAFEGATEVILLPVYAASESPLKGGCSEDLLNHFKQAGTMPARLAHSMDEARRWLDDAREPGDLVLVVGAGDVVELAEWMRKDWAT